jgi:ParB-like chromosome segregation protein Spo0J
LSPIELIGTDSDDYRERNVLEWYCNMSVHRTPESVSKTKKKELENLNKADLVAKLLQVQEDAGEAAGPHAGASGGAAGEPLAKQQVLISLMKQQQEDSQRAMPKKLPDFKAWRMSVANMRRSKNGKRSKRQTVARRSRNDLIVSWPRSSRDSNNPHSSSRPEVEGE